MNNGVFVGLRQFCTKLTLLLGLTLILTPLAWGRKAGLDYRAGFAGRSLPIGGAAYGELGYGIPFWGNWEDSIFYGYIRPNIQLASALTYNSLDAELEFYPISFFGLIIGQNHVWRPETRDKSVVDCDQYYCGGEVQGQYIEYDLALAYGGWFLLSKGGISKVESDNPSLPFYEDGETLIAASLGDQVEYLDIGVGRQVLGFPKLGDTRIGLSGRYAVAKQSGDFSNRTSFFLNHKARGLNWTYAIGQYENRRKSAGVQLALIVEWTPEQGLSLR